MDRVWSGDFQVRTGNFSQRVQSTRERRTHGLLVEGGIAVAPFTEAEEPEQNSKDNETANTANHTPDDCAYIFTCQHRLDERKATDLCWTCGTFR